jgi:sulfatase modifying factor 1
MGRVLFILAGVMLCVSAQAQDTFQDCADCPEMVVVPAGTYLMGAPPNEADRQAWDGPQVNVSFAEPFAIARTETTYKQFAAFMRETSHRIAPGCNLFNGSWRWVEDAAWNNTNFPMTDDHPAVCVGWYDALAFIAWLNAKGEHTYYLPSEAEFEYASRAGSTTTFPWGDDRADICDHANVSGLEVKAAWQHVDAHACDDGFIFAAPVKSFPPNAFGLHDMFGNVWEWNADCWSFSHASQAMDGSPVTQGFHCERRIIKGTGYESVARYARSAARGRDPIPGTRIAVIGFRVAAKLK